MFGLIALIIASVLAVELVMRRGGKFGELFQSNKLSDLKDKASDLGDDLKNKFKGSNDISDKDDDLKY